MFRKKKRSGKNIFIPRFMFEDAMPIPLTDRRYNNLKNIAESYDDGGVVLITILTLANMGLLKTKPFEGDSDYDS